MADGKIGEEKPEKTQQAGVAGGPKPKEETEKPVKTKTVSSGNRGELSLQH